MNEFQVVSKILNICKEEVAFNRNINFVKIDLIGFFPYYFGVDACDEYECKKRFTLLVNVLNNNPADNLGFNIHLAYVSRYILNIILK